MREAFFIGRGRCGVRLTIGEGDLRDVAIEHDNLLDDGVDEFLELGIADTHSERGEINIAVRHRVLEQQARGFLKELLVRERDGEDGSLLLLFYIALQACDVIVQAVFLAQEIDLRHLLLGVEKKVHEAGQSAAVLLEFCRQVLLAGLRRRADTRFADG